MSEPITIVQDLHLQLISRISFNDFDGALVAQGLIAHRDLWVGVIAAHSFRQHPAHRLFAELPEDEWSPDTLWIMAVNANAAAQLAQVCRADWYADEAEILTPERVEALLGQPELIDDEVLMRVWWD